MCEHVQKDLRGTENEFTLGSRKLRHGQQSRSDIQTFSNILGLGQKFVDEVLTIRAGGSNIVGVDRVKLARTVNVGGMVITEILNCSPRSQRLSTWTAIG